MSGFVWHLSTVTLNVTGYDLVFVQSFVAADGKWISLRFEGIVVVPLPNSLLLP